MAPKKSADNIFDMSFRGGLPDILRRIAAELDAERVTADTYTCTVKVDVFDLAVRINLKS